MKILAFPKDTNPYQELLYSEVRKQGIPVSYLEAPFKSATAGLILRPLQLLKFKLEGYTHFHLHWLYPFRFAIKSTLTDNILTKAFFTLYFVLMIYWLKLLGYKIIWTVHNILPHDKTFIDDLTVTKYLASHADTVIAHSQQTIDEMKSLAIGTERCTVIPIGSYIGVYPNEISQQDARTKLGIDQENFVIGFVGRIEPYKGVLKLIKAFKEINQTHTTLLIAGPCSNQELKNEIHQATKEDKNIITHMSYIPDNDLQIYLNASDIIALPFEKITTSSTIILASSFAKAVLYPNLGNLKDLPEDIGIKYDPNDPDGLKNTLMKTMQEKNKIKELGRNGYIYAENIEWNNITYQLILKLKEYEKK